MSNNSAAESSNAPIKAEKQQPQIKRFQPPTPEEIRNGVMDTGRHHLKNKMDTSVTATQVLTAQIRAKLAAGEVKVPPLLSPSQARKRKTREGEPVTKDATVAQHPPPAKEHATSCHGEAATFRGEGPDRTFLNLNDRQGAQRINQAMKQLVPEKDVDILRSTGVQQEVDSMRKAWFELSVCKEAVGQSLFSLIEQNKDQSGLLDDAKNKLQALEKAKGEAEQKVENLTKELESLKEENKSQKSSLKHCHDRLNLYKADKDDAIKRSDEAKNKLEALEKTKGEAEQKVENLTKELECLKEENQKQKSSYKYCLAMMNLYMAEKDDAIKRADELQKQVANLQSRSDEEAVKSWLITPAGKQFKADVGASASVAISDFLKAKFQQALDRVAPSSKDAILYELAAIEKAEMEKIRQEVMSQIATEEKEARQRELKAREEAARLAEATEDKSREKTVSESLSEKSSSSSQSLDVDSSSEASSTQQSGVDSSDSEVESEDSVDSLN